MWWPSAWVAESRDVTVNDETQNEEEPLQLVRWDCFSCGKRLGEHGAGGSFTLNFGYGSRLDLTENIAGWICDECVAQKHARLRVSRVSAATAGIAYWSVKNMTALAEDESTKTAIADTDFFGRKTMPWALDERQRPRAVQGWRLYHSITSEERSRVEAWLFDEKPLDRDVVVKLLQAIMESEAKRAEAEHERWEAEVNATARARNQAERLSADELAQLRVREAKKGLTPEEVRRVWEHALWNEDHFREEKEDILDLRARVKELEAENAALKKRIAR